MVKIPDMLMNMMPKTETLEDEDAAMELLISEGQGNPATKWGLEDQEPVWTNPVNKKPPSIGAAPQATMPIGPMPSAVPSAEEEEEEFVGPEGPAEYDEEALNALLNQQDIEQAAGDEMYQAEQLAMPPRKI